MKVFVAFTLLTITGAALADQAPSFSLDQLSRAATKTPLPNSPSPATHAPAKANATAAKPAATAAKPAAPAKPESVLEIKRKAEAGDAKAQIAFAQQFVAMQKFSSAEYWYRQAGLQGEPTAIFALAEMYRSTAGAGTNMVKANPTNSITLHKLAAGLGHGQSHFQLGMAFKNGTPPVRKDPVLAYYHLKVSNVPGWEGALNQLVAEMSQPQIDTAEKMSADYKPAKFEEAFANLVFESIRITGIFGGANGRMAMIDGKPINAGQKLELNVGGLKANVQFDEIASDSVFVSYNSVERKIKPQRM